MSDLEKNLEGTIEEANGPKDGAEKGDQKPVKLPSSGDAEVGSGKGEVVKPEENPVDKAVNSVKSAEGSSKEISNDPQQKGEAPAEKKPMLKKVKEDEEASKEDVVEMSKMETIKAMVNKMKGMDKQDLQAMYSEMVGEEVDESLSKAEIARNMVEFFKSLDEESLTEKYKKHMKASYKMEENEEEEEEVEVDEQVSNELENDLVEIEVDEDLSAISESLELSEENAEKAKTIFKAAVNSKVKEINEQLKGQYDEELKTTVEKVKTDLSEAVDKYLSYVAEEWAKENELAIERGLRAEMTENFIDGLKTLFVEHYVDVPEEKYNVIDELANRLDEMEQKLDSEVNRNIEIVEELDSLKRDNVVREACEDLTDSQTEKLSSLVEGVDFKDVEDFQEKVAELKEAYFPKESEVISEETIENEGEGSFDEDLSEDKVLDPTMSQYANAISKLKPLGNK
jgi:hypothetical protein